MLPALSVLPAMRRPAASATVLVLATGALVLASAAPATAEGQRLDDGEIPTDGLTAIETLLVYVGAPALLFLVIALLVLAPSAARGPRYRPGLGWWAAPVWFNGPDDADAAVRRASPTTEGGGASARW